MFPDKDCYAAPLLSWKADIVFTVMALLSYRKSLSFSITPRLVFISQALNRYHRNGGPHGANKIADESGGNHILVYFFKGKINKLIGWKKLTVKNVEW